MSHHPRSVFAGCFLPWQSHGEKHKQRGEKAEARREAGKQLTKRTAQGYRDFDLEREQ